MVGRLFNYAMSALPAALLVTLTLYSIILGIFNPQGGSTGLYAVPLLTILFILTWAALFAWLIFEDPDRPHEQRSRGFDVLPPK